MLAKVVAWTCRLTTAAPVLYVMMRPTLFGDGVSNAWMTRRVTALKPTTVKLSTESVVSVPCPKTTWLAFAWVLRPKAMPIVPRETAACPTAMALLKFWAICPPQAANEYEQLLPTKLYARAALAVPFVPIPELLAAKQLLLPDWMPVPDWYPRAMAAHLVQLSPTELLCENVFVQLLPTLALHAENTVSPLVPMVLCDMDTHKIE